MANHAVIAPTFVGHPGYDDVLADTGTLVISQTDTNLQGIEVGIGTNAPDSKLHVDSDLAASGTAVHVQMENTADSIGVNGVQVDGTPLTFKGGQVGVIAQTSKTGGADPQRGSANGRLASVDGFFAQGNFVGAHGTSNPGTLDNFDGTRTSAGLGGRFTVDSGAGLTMDAGTGTYWVGGAYGEVRGEYDTAPTTGAIAGVIGVNSATGDAVASTYAGYFRGNVKTVGGLCVDDPGTAATCPTNAAFVAGGIIADSTITAAAFDLAERFPLLGSAEPGDVVLASAVSPGSVGVEGEPASSRVVGIVTTTPGLVLGWPEEGTAVVALAGRVPVKVTDEGGAIEVGDLLVSSTTPGHAMGARQQPAPGTVLGKALAPFDGETGTVMALVLLS